LNINAITIPKKQSTPMLFSLKIKNIAKKPHLNFRIHFNVKVFGGFGLFVCLWLMGFGSFL